MSDKGAERYHDEQRALVDLNINLRSDEQERLAAHRHAEIVDLLQRIHAQGHHIMATSKELVTLANALGDAVSQIPPAIDKLEAAVTAALAKLPTIPADVQADIDAAFATMQGSLDEAQAAVADAADGVDEAGLTVPTP